MEEAKKIEAEEKLLFADRKNKTCEICYEIRNIDNEMITLPCDHMFCT